MIAWEFTIEPSPVEMVLRKISSFKRERGVKSEILKFKY